MKKKELFLSLGLAFCTSICVAPCLGANDIKNEKETVNANTEKNNIAIQNIYLPSELFLADLEVDIVKCSNTVIDNQYGDEITVTRKTKKNKAKKEKFKQGYINGLVYVRTSPEYTDNIIDALYFKDSVKYRKYEKDNHWSVIKYKGKEMYICSDFVSDIPVNYTKYIADYNIRMSYEPYTATVWAWNNFEYIGNYGICMIGDRYCIALGSAYTTENGKYIDVVLENGTIIPCILADSKADCDTNYWNTVGVDGSAVEFIVDGWTIREYTKNTGDLRSVCPEWNSPVKEIRVYENTTMEK